jgi:hypothetical protein
VFLILNGLGVTLGTIYNVSTPDLYEHNAHHKIGWIATWVVTAQVVMSLLFLYSGRSEKKTPAQGERAAFLPVSPTETMVNQPMSAYHDYRWSGDSGQGTERSSTQSSRDASPTNAHRYVKPEPQPDDDDEEDGLPMPMPSLPSPPRASLFRIRIVDTFLTRRVPGLMSTKILRSLEVAYEVIDRTILILGFVALMTGGVTYAGIFVSRSLPIQKRFAANTYTAWQQCIQWPCTLHQRRNILLVWIVNVGKMDGLLCRLWLGMEPQAKPKPGWPMEGSHSVG